MTSVDDSSVMKGDLESMVRGAETENRIQSFHLQGLLKSNEKYKKQINIFEQKIRRKHSETKVVEDDLGKRDAHNKAMRMTSLDMKNELTILRLQCEKHRKKIKELELELADMINSFENEAFDLCEKFSVGPALYTCQILLDQRQNLKFEVKEVETVNNGIKVLIEDFTRAHGLKLREFSYDFLKDIVTDESELYEQESELKTIETTNLHTLATLEEEKSNSDELIIEEKIAKLKKCVMK